jgi:hypothetical protein
MRLSNQDMVHRANVRAAYDSAAGRAELMRLLADLGLFREISIEELSKRNYAVRKLEELGFLDSEMIVQTVEWLFRQPLALRPTIEEMGGVDSDDDDLL